jgi:hypothetical protein
MGITWREVGWRVSLTLVGGLVVGLGGAIAGYRTPTVGSGDPPIIVHGGSFHADIIAKKEPGSGNNRVIIPMGKVTGISTGYYGLLASGPVPGAPVKLTGGWEVDLCNKDGWKSNDCKAQGLKICASDDSGACIPLGSGTNGTKITLDLLDNTAGDTLTELAGKRKPAPPYGWGYKLKPGSGDTYHPDYLVIRGTTGAPYFYQCGPDTSTGDNDWLTCWVAIGKY